MNQLLTTGDVFEIEPGDKVYASVPQHFLYSNRVGCWECNKGEVVVKGVFAFMAGTYIVTKTAEDGGGTAMCNDHYPNGHHVWAVKADNPNVTVDFYQTGCFTAMITNRVATGRAQASWSIQARNADPCEKGTER